MCGHAGAYYFDRHATAPRSDVAAAIAAIEHRGPDDHGLWQAPGICLGFRRLSILDLSPAGHQPMVLPDHPLAIVFNGEIYNYLELRPPLAARGHVFGSQSDTEVLVRHFVEHGPGGIRDFNGMWSFAIYDTRSHGLFCSRDRFGVKPFYYYVDREKFLFASEIKALLAMGVEPEEDPQAVFDYVALGRLDASETTFFRGIRQLAPGSSLFVGPSGVRVEPYWKLPDLDNEACRLSLEDAAAKTRELLLDAIRLRLRSDVPLGILLSGGLDSSSIVCGADTLGRREPGTQPLGLRAFAAIYDDPTVDERLYIDAVVNARKIDCTRVMPEAGSIASDMERVIHHQDEPVASTTVFAHWYLMKAIREQGITVILSGQGADECLAGYLTQFLGFHLRDLIAAGDVFGAVAEMSALRRHHSVPFKRLAIQLLKSLAPRRIGAAFKSGIDDQGFRFISRDAWLRHGWDHDASRRLALPSSLNRQMHFYLTEGSLPRILHYEDRNSMAHSIEERTPFLDYRLVEHFFALPNSFKIRNGTSKVVLREAMRDELPPLVRDRQSKIGFGTPEAEWLRTGLRELALDTFGSAAFRSRWYLNGERAQADAIAILDNRRRYTPLLWRALNLELWRNVFITSGGVRADVHA